MIAGSSLFIASCTSPGQANSETKQSVRTQTEVVQLTDITDYFEAPGTVRAKIQTILSSKTMGQIITVGAREGDRVRQGDVLIEIEGQDTAAQLRKAQAALVETNRLLDEAEGSIRAS